jgi:hypothetical protein
MAKSWSLDLPGRGYTDIIFEKRFVFSPLWRILDIVLMRFPVETVKYGSNGAALHVDLGLIWAASLGCMDD